MARIYGTIESLKSLKSELENRGIFRFNSVKEINDFLLNYNSEKLAIRNKASEQSEKQYVETCTKLKQNVETKAKIINLESSKIENEISDLQTKIDLITTKNYNFLQKLISNIKRYYIKRQLNYLLDNKTRLIHSSIKSINTDIENDNLFIKEYETRKQDLVKEKTKSEIEKLEYTRSVIENSRNLISGAIGEHLVVKEIKKLSDDYTLINDFNLSFDSPIFFKKQNHRIHSIQIDHLLISKAGIFIIETKNWSKSSVNSINLRSPIEQIERSNFALYIYISENIVLNRHHWGESKIPIRNLIVMIKNKPTTQFKYVSVKLLNEMNNYIEYFDPVLTDKQLNQIISKLI